MSLMGDFMSLRTLSLGSAIALTLATPTLALEAPNRYSQTNFVANRAQYHPKLSIERGMINAWGVAIRPAGAGGHFWVTARDISYEYVGDVSASSDVKLRTMHQDSLKIVTLPVGGNDKFATGVVFNDSKDNFIITQEIDGVAPITAPAKFLFASDGGIISAWTERKKADGTFDRAGIAIPVIDQSSEGAQYFGLALSSDYDRLYAANFGNHPDIQVFNGEFKAEKTAFDMPFDSNKNGIVDAGEYAAFNVQAMATPEGSHHIFVTYAKTQPCTRQGIAAKACKKGELFAGEEDTSKPGYGKLAEFTEDGELVAVWNDGGKLSAPWGLAYAPENFGKLSGALLVSNFGDGSIAAYDATTHAFIDVLRDTKGHPIKIKKIWGIVFGNGASLGDANTLYFAAGPRDEKDGVFGSIRVRK